MKRSEEREYNIRRVIHTAQMLFIADGISATPISRIAEAAGLTPTSLYRYFRNKDALVFAAWRDALATFFADFMEQYAREAASCKTGYEKFVACMHIYFRIYDRRPEWYDYTREMFSAYSEKGRATTSTMFSGSITTARSLPRRSRRCVRAWPTVRSAPM